MTNEVRAPRFSWPVFLGAAGFVSGFLGPLMFTPESNQGPLVGLLISGPAGVLLGFALFGLCSTLRISARTQWRMLLVTAVVGAVAVLLLVQPQPALRGYLMDLEIQSCSTPGDREQQVLEEWSKRLAGYQSVTPREGWQEDLRQKLREAPGALIEVDVRRQVSVWENRKPWNRGSLFSVAGRNAPEEHAFYAADRSCADLPAQREISVFEKYDLNGPIRPPSEWPPRVLEQFIGVSPVVAVPPAYEHLM